MDKKSHSSAYRWVMFILALLITVITSIEMLLPAPLLTAIIEDTKWSIGAAGQLLSIISLLMGIFVIAGSPIMDKLGLIKLTVISLFVMAIGGIIPFFAGDSYPLHYFGRFLFGVGYGASLNAAPIVIGLWFSPKEQPAMQGIRVAVSYLGMTLTYFVVVPIFKVAQSWQNTFGIVGVAVCVVAVVWLLFGKMPEAPQGEILGTSNNVDLKDVSIVDRKPVREESGLMQAAKLKEVWFLWLGMIGMIWAFNTYNAFLPTYLSEVRGFTIEAASSATGTMTIFGLIAGLVAGGISSALGRRKIMGWPVMTLALLGVFFVIFADGILMYLGIGFIGVASSAYAVMFSTVPAELPGSNEKMMGGAMAIIIGVAYIPTFFVPNCFEFFLPILGMQNTMLLFGCTFIISIPPLVLIKETGPKGKANVLRENS